MEVAETEERTEKAEKQRGCQGMVTCRKGYTT
jgi:hypothetical protein